jgi:hypothetical protein
MPRQQVPFARVLLVAVVLAEVACFALITASILS